MEVLANSMSHLTSGLNISKTNVWEAAGRRAFMSSELVIQRWRVRGGSPATYLACCFAVWDCKHLLSSACMLLAVVVVVLMVGVAEQTCCPCDGGMQQFWLP